MVRPAGWTTQLPHPRSGEHKDGFYMLCYISSYISRFRFTLLHTSHEDLRRHGATRQVRAVSSIRVAGDRRNWKDKVRGGWVRLLPGRPTNFSVFQVPRTCSITGNGSNAAEGALPLLSDNVQPPSRQLWLNLQVEGAEEALPDGLQRLAVAPDHRMAFMLFRYLCYITAFNSYKAKQ